MLEAGEIDSFASAGNTGAMFFGCMMTVKTVPGLLRPCIVSPLPQENGETAVIVDAGANVDCKPEILDQFGILGSVFMQSVHNIEKPRVALLNVGEEKSKGNLLAKAAHPILSENNKLNFVGNMESNQLFTDFTDVMVCDGFTGNIVLKQAEAMYWMMKRMGHESKFFDELNYENHGGCPILGSKKPIMIGHGVSNAVTMKNLIHLSKNVIKADLATKIEEALK